MVPAVKRFEDKRRLSLAEASLDFIAGKPGPLTHFVPEEPSRFVGRQETSIGQHRQQGAFLSLLCEQFACVGFADESPVHEQGQELRFFGRELHASVTKVAKDL